MSGYFLATSRISGKESWEGLEGCYCLQNHKTFNFALVLCVLESRDNGFSSEWFTTFLPHGRRSIKPPPINSGPNKIKSGPVGPSFNSRTQSHVYVLPLTPTLPIYTRTFNKTLTMSPPPDARDPPIRRLVEN